MTNIVAYAFINYNEVYQHRIIGNQIGKSVPVKVEGKVARNAVQKIREGLLMSKAELARKAGVSPLTIDRVERGKDCRMETKRKIILALGYNLSDKSRLFPED